MKRRGISQSNLGHGSHDGWLQLNLTNQYADNGAVVHTLVWRPHWAPVNSLAAATLRSRPWFD
jgi:hypothetical protein